MEWLKALLADRRRAKNVAVLAFVVLMVNLPLALATWTNLRVESAGTDVTAEVTAARNLGTPEEPRWWVSYRFPEDVDPEQGTWAGEVDRATWTAAEESGSITVRVLEGSPSRHTVSGEVRSWVGLWSTLLFDAILVAVLVLVWRVRVLGRKDAEPGPEPGRSRGPRREHPTHPIHPPLRRTGMTSLGDFKATGIDGTETDLASYDGQVVLVVNTASQCGFTPQYQGLQELQDTYGERGFTVLGFPCDQFGGQEPGTDEEIASFCERNFGVDFPLFAKVDVNGDERAPALRVAAQGEGGLLGRQDQVELHQVPHRPRRRRRSTASRRPPSRPSSPPTSSGSSDASHARRLTPRGDLPVTSAAGEGRPMAATASSYSITMRLHTAPDHGVVGTVATTIAEGGGIVTAIDVTESRHDRLVVDVTCSASDEGHSKELVAVGRGPRRRRGPQGQRPDLPAAHRRQDRGRVEGAAAHPRRPLDGLHPGRRPGQHGDPRQPRGRAPADHQGQLGRGGDRRLGRARARQHRARRRPAGDGGQGRAVQAVRRHRRLADLPGHPGHRRDRARRRDDRAGLRRHQPRGHRRPALLRDRAPAARVARHPGLPRRPARHGDRGARRADQRAALRQEVARATCASWSPAPAPPAPRS